MTEASFGAVFVIPDIIDNMPSTISVRRVHGILNHSAKVVIAKFLNMNLFAILIDISLFNNTFIANEAVTRICRQYAVNLANARRLTCR